MRGTLKPVKEGVSPEIIPGFVLRAVRPHRMAVWESRSFRPVLGRVAKMVLALNSARWGDKGCVRFRATSPPSDDSVLVWRVETGEWLPMYACKEEVFRAYQAQLMRSLEDSSHGTTDGE
jgi:hypothetical protein